jgi:hypothetical protein
MEETGDLDEVRKPRTVSLWDVVTMSDLDLDLSGAE